MEMRCWTAIYASLSVAAACTLIGFPPRASLAADVSSTAAIQSKTQKAESANQTPAALVDTKTPGVDKSVVKSDIRKLFMWRVDGPKGTVYLLGSIHALRPGCYPLPKEMEAAFGSSQVLAVEIDMNKLTQEELTKLLKDDGIYAYGDQLSNHISPATYSMLESYLSDAKMSPMLCARMRPWLASMIIPFLSKSEDIRASEGIDRHFLYEARVKGKEIVELETPQSQMEIFSKLAEPTQEKLLKSSLLSEKHYSSSFDKLFHAWQQGDARTMEQLVISSGEQMQDIKSFRDELFNKRNVAMTLKIINYLNTPGTCFVVVGAGHMVGPKGIVNLLRDQKYQVDQVTYVSATPAPLKTTATFTPPWSQLETQAEKSIAANDFPRAHQQLTACLAQVSKLPPMIKIDPEYPLVVKELHRLENNWQLVFNREVQDFKKLGNTASAPDADFDQREKYGKRRIQLLSELANDCKVLRDLDSKLLGVNNPQTLYWDKLYQWVRERVVWLKS